MHRLRVLIGHEDDGEAIRDTLIEVYREYNAPLPQELMPKEILESIKNLD